MGWGRRRKGACRGAEKCLVRGQMIMMMMMMRGQTMRGQMMMMRGQMSNDLMRGQTSNDLMRHVDFENCVR